MSAPKHIFTVIKDDDLKTHSTLKGAADYAGVSYQHLLQTKAKGLQVGESFEIKGWTFYKTELLRAERSKS
ncbi:hypothetical protein BFP72_07375 [Reichenbachiella sp. 5M10]|uniref:hypothetical protein n=1 Tax=Reichenbachiella sp. 5M10 TaxID=1889772 RepID=UPI000C14C00A|nr:hypothetical protein [Reichenbachiella sp. 5M10]PIB35229.1 hypothetical protein BFP72_07375 [Reichenbachiella sp. 5M10]